MSTQVSFRADRISFSLPSAYNGTSANDAALLQVMPPVADPVSDAFNNVRFLVAGTAGHGTRFSMFTLVTRHRFDFTADANGLLSASSHFAARGAHTLLARGDRDWFGLESLAHYSIRTSMKAEVRTPSGDIVLLARSGTEEMAARAVATNAGLRRDVGAVEVPPFEHSMTRNYSARIFTGDRISITAVMRFAALASDGGEFTLDFSRQDRLSTDFDDGLNSPLCIIRIR